MAYSNKYSSAWVSSVSFLTNIVIPFCYKLKINCVMSIGSNDTLVVITSRSYIPDAFVPCISPYFLLRL